MLMIQIIVYFTFIFNLLSCLPIETESNVTINEHFDHTTSLMQPIENSESDKDFNSTNISVQTKPELTIFEFLNYTTFSYLTFSPTGQDLFFVTSRPLWERDSYEDSLWMYNIENEKKTLITKDLYGTPQLSPTGDYIVLFLKKKPVTNITNDHELLRKGVNDTRYYIYLYSIDSNEFLSIGIQKQFGQVFTWSNNDSSIYFVSKNIDHNTIYRIDFNRENNTISTDIHFIKNISFSISEFLFVPLEEKLVFTSVGTAIKSFQDCEIYSLDLKNLSSLIKLTNNTIQEAQLQLSTDRKNVLFSVGVEVSDPIDHTNQGLYSLNLTNGEITHIGNTSEGCIMGYAPKFEGGVYILEQRKTNVHIFLRQSSDEDRFDDVEYSGTFHSIASSSNPNCLIAYVWSSSEWPMEIYCANDISDLSSAEQITNENDLFTQRNLPQIEIYNWTNPDDDIIIEGILHYPPGKFQSTNLPLLVLIHGGPNSASLNQMDGSYSDWAPLAASNGWLVLEPNYRGSTGYGEEFESELRGKPMSLAGKDILSGVDQLVKAGIADPHKLAVGGYSFGGFLTNWLITQTKRFNAALSCAGSVEFVSDWGIADAPDFYEYWFKALPWEMPHLYKYEAPIYQMDRVRTPTYICTGVKDKRVPAFQSYILKRALDSRGIPAQLQTFPNEGHSFYHPQSQLKKIEGELAWLKKYGRGQN